jgi:hypothetical protein
MYHPLTSTIAPALAPPWQTTSCEFDGEGVELGVGAGLGDSAGLAATTVGSAVACAWLGDGERATASQPCEAPTPHALAHKITSARPASRTILEG